MDVITSPCRARRCCLASTYLSQGMPSAECNFRGSQWRCFRYWRRRFGGTPCHLSHRLRPCPKQVPGQRCCRNNGKIIKHRPKWMCETRSCLGQGLIWTPDLADDSCSPSATSGPGLGIRVIPVTLERGHEISSKFVGHTSAKIKTWYFCHPRVR